MKVKPLMHQPAVTCRASDSLNQAAALMWEHDCGALPVVDDDGRPIGVITDRDICMAAYTQGSPIHAIPVGNIMATPAHSVRADADISEAEEIMRNRQVRRLPVVEDGGQVVGMLSMNDLIREADGKRTRRKREVSTEEVISALAAVGTPRTVPVAVS